MMEFIKLLLSKDFVSNFKEIITILRRSSEWRKDIVVYKGKFLNEEKDESQVLIKEALKMLRQKEWSEEETGEISFVLSEIIDNSFKYGIKNPEFGFVQCTLTITSSFIKMQISDNGVNFDLKEELRKQGAFEEKPDKHRGLSFVFKIAPEISQEKAGVTNTIIVIKRKGVKRFKFEKYKDIIIVNVGNNFGEDQTAFNSFVTRIQQLSSDSKIIINLDTDDYSWHENMSRAIRDIRTTLVKVQNEKGNNVVVCGLDYANFAVKEYFEKYFVIRTNLFESIEYFEEAS